MKRKPRFTVTMDTSLYAESMSNLRERGERRKSAGDSFIDGGRVDGEKKKGQLWLDEIWRLKLKLCRLHYSPQLTDY